MPDCGFGGGGLHGAGVGGGEGVDVLAVALVKAAEGIFPQGAVRRGLQQDIVGAGDLMALPRAVRSRVEDQVGVLQAVRDLGGGAGHLAEAGQQFFLRRGEGVGLAAQQIFQQEAVTGQPLVGGDGAQRLFRQGEDLRLGKGKSGHRRRIPGRDAGVHALGGFGAGVLAVAHGSVAVQVGQLAGQRRGGFQILQDGGCVGQPAGEGGHPGHQAVQFGEGLFPGRVVDKQAGEVPGELLVDGGAFFECFGHRAASFLCDMPAAVRPYR